MAAAAKAWRGVKQAHAPTQTHTHPHLHTPTHAHAHARAHTHTYSHTTHMRRASGALHWKRSKNTFLCSCCGERDGLRKSRTPPGCQNSKLLFPLISPSFGDSLIVSSKQWIDKHQQSNAFPGAGTTASVSGVSVEWSFCGVWSGVKLGSLELRLSLFGQQTLFVVLHCPQHLSSSKSYSFLKFRRLLR